MVKNIFRNSQKILERESSNILSAAAIITAAIFLSSLLGLIKNRLLVSFFFDDPTARASLDAFWVAFRIPDLLFQLLIIGTLSGAFIPVFTKYLKKDPAKADELASTIVNTTTLIFLIISAIFFVFAKPLTQLFTGENFTPQQLSLAIKFSRTILIAQFFFSISNFLTTLVQAHKRFIIPALAPSAYNLGIIAGIIILGPQFGVFGAAIGVIFGSILHLLLQIPLTLKLGFRYQPKLNFKLKGVKEIFLLTPPRTFAISIIQIETLVFTFLATTLSQGSLTIFTLAQQLMNLPVRIFAIPIGQASLPFLSQESAKNELKEFSQTLFSSLYQILYLAFPASAVLIVLRIPLVRIAYGASAFPWAATLTTGKMVAILSLGVVAHASTQLLNRAFYALHNTSTPLVAALVSIIVSVVLAVFLVMQTSLDILGIALGATAGAFAQVAFLFASLASKLDGFSWKTALTPPAKMATAAVLMGAFLWAFMRFFDEFVFDTTRTINLILLTVSVGLIGATVYWRLSRVLSIKQLDSYLKLAHKIGNWRQVLSTSQETIDQTSSTL